jgi:hypothetical protein
MAPCTIVVLEVLLGAIVVLVAHPRRMRTCIVDKGMCGCSRRHRWHCVLSAGVGADIALRL